ncbi:MAG: hypothetical protein H0T11_02955 [Chthoniobacterales bacterium]|nr:hypothetical protein [Chthoniobacterales bacterium]
MIREALDIEGERIRRTRLVHTDRYVIAVEVEMIVPSGDPSEPCYGPTVTQFLKQVHEHAEQDDLDWLRRHGKVYSAVDAA